MENTCREAYDFSRISEEAWLNRRVMASRICCATREAAQPFPNANACKSVIRGKAGHVVAQLKSA